MDPYALTPEQQQQILAATVRGKEMAAEAARRGSRYDTLAAIAPMLNNKGIESTAKTVSKRAQDAAELTRLGNTGFMVSDTGEFIESPMYVREKMETRQQQRAAQAERLENQRELQAERLAAQAQRQADSNALRMTLASMRGPGSSAAADKAAAKAEKDRSTEVQKLSAAIEKSGGAEFGEALNLVENTLNKYKPGKLPGFGRVLSSVPSWALDTESQNARADMAQAANILLKARSGAAVTDSEMRRFLTEVAQGKGMSEDTMRRGWANVRGTYNARMSNITAGASPEAYDEYLGRGGSDVRPKGATKSGTKRLKYNPETGALE